MEGDIPDGLVLEATEEGLELRRRRERPGLGIRAELTAHRRGPHALGRALRGCPGSVVDATAGLGSDTAVLASLGREVLAIERNEVLFALLREAHARLGEDEQAKRITLRCADSLEELPRLDGRFAEPAAIVIDPMYPARRSTNALPPKPMQLMRELHGGLSASDDAEALVETALRTVARRIVLKRPPEAPSPKCAGSPTFSIESKLVRWDVWDRG